MLMSIDTQHNRSWEEFFEQAAKDTSSYLWSVEEWADPSEDIQQDYLLITILSSRRRSHLAIEQMNADLPEEYASYKEPLVAMKQKTEKLLNDLYISDCEKIQAVIDNEVISRLDMLEEGLQKVRRIDQNRNLFEDSEWMDVNLREAASDFLIPFQDMALTNEELRETPFRKKTDSRIFQKKFAEIEERFKCWFGHFHLIHDRLRYLRAREYDSGTWWFASIPEPDDIPEEKIPEKAMAGFRKTFQEAGASKQPYCPESDDAEAYASYMLDIRKNRQFHEHLLTCRFCLDLVLDKRIKHWASKDN
ncbi:MAG: hypothetical protein DRI57_29360 [Deltaproteobacteria bacterium]|nr:MAG: hypothetical protein DRI57_29360 [Deltaproteobacteria bacterium]